MASFLDKALTKLQEGTDYVKAETKATMDKARIKSAIETLERERSQFINRLGFKVLELHESAGEEPPTEIPVAEISDIIAEIKTRAEKIAEQQAALKKVDEDLAQTIRSSAPPQPQYGTPPGGMYPPGAPPPIPGGKTCGCGKMSMPEAKFCTGCGGAFPSPVEPTAE